MKEIEALAIYTVKELSNGWNIPVSTYSKPFAPVNFQLHGSAEDAGY